VETFWPSGVSSKNDLLSISVDGAMTKNISSRAYLPIKIAYEINKTLLLDLDYASKSNHGNSTFMIEFRENDHANEMNKVLWSSLLHDTSGKLTNDSFILPDNKLNKPVEFRLYVITDNNGKAALSIKRADIVLS